jgi:outer membrane receptor protein involved in Fe transport
LHGQQQTASITGRITDASGAAIPGAMVTVTNVERGIKRVATANGEGSYAIPLLPPAGGYSVTVQKAGFSVVSRDGLVLEVSQIAEINLSLPAGNVDQNVTVTGAPPLLDTETSSVGQVIPGKTITDLALNGRSTFRLIQLTPGITFNQGASQFGDVPANTTFDSNFAINGSRAQSNDILIDGVPATAGYFDQITTIPSVDDTQEFKVISNNPSAEYGRYSGGVINVTTKAGTDEYHGTIFEFLRNDVLNTNEWFNKQAGHSKPVFIMNQFGFAAGGPVILPKVYNGRGKTFFFADFQGTRRIQGVPSSFTVPTAQERTGDFSGLGVKIYNPFSTVPDSAHPGQYVRTQFSGNVISPQLLDPVALQILKYIPLPNVSIPGSSINYSVAPKLTIDANSGSIRIDENVTKNYRSFGRYAYFLNKQTQPNTYGNVATPGAGAVGTTQLNNWSFARNNTIILKPSLFLTVNYGWARWYQMRKTLSYGFDNSTLGFPASYVNSIELPAFPQVSIAGYSNTNGQGYLDNGNDTHSLLNSLTFLHGRQTITVGTDIRLRLINFFNAPSPAGAFNFTKAQTQGPNPQVASAVAGDAFAAFLLGAGNSGSIPLVEGTSLKDWYYAGYVQDDIQLTPKLTVNAGLRYETESPVTERHNRLNYFDPSVPSPAANAEFPSLAGGLVFAGIDGHPSTVYRWNKAQFAPRVGFSFSPHDETVIRGGFGTSYAPLEISNSTVGFSANTGFGATTSWNVSNNGGLNPANLLQNPYPQGLLQPTGATLGAATALGQSISVWDPNPKTPQSYQWNLGVEQQFPSNTVLNISYVADRGLHLTDIFQLDQLNASYLSLGTALTVAVPNPFQPFVSIGTLSNKTVARQQLLLPYPQFTGVTEVNATWGKSNYQSMQVTLNKRTTHGISFLVAYTWSKWMSNVPNEEAQIGTANSSSVQDYGNLAAEYSLSETDQPLNLVANTVVKLPFGRGAYFLNNVHGLADKLVSGWNASAIVLVQSGYPLAFSASTPGLGNRPNVVPGVNPALPSNRSNTDKTREWFNPAAFAVPAPYSLGDVPRTWGAVRGPALRNTDFTLFKDTSITGRWTMQFRAEVFNLTNTPHFGLPNTSANATAFGQITNTLLSPEPRQLQFAVKLMF